MMQPFLKTAIATASIGMISMAQAGNLKDGIKPEQTEDSFHHIVGETNFYDKIN